MHYHNYMKITYKRSYKKLNRKSEPIVVFVYEVSGTDEQLERYKELSGEHYRESEDKKPVYFSTRYLGETGKILITTNDKIVADTSEFDKAVSIVSQYGGNLGNALAGAFAAKLMGTPVSTEPATTDEPIDELG